MDFFPAVIVCSFSKPTPVVYNGKQLGIIPLFTIVKYALFTFVNMEKMTIASYEDYLKSYSLFKDQKLRDRYLNFDHIEDSLKNLGSTFKIEKVGISHLGEPIHKISVGDGKIKILAWSQMHGNESTTTKAIFDILRSFQLYNGEAYVKSILENIQIAVIPMLNPDGARSYTRVNSRGVDLNRDAHVMTEEESKVLRKVYEEFKPDYCFNLHDQRSIFSAGPFPLPATVSFLTPAMNEERSVTPSRRSSMKVIVAMNERLQEKLPGMVGRYSDAFNINCTGDTFQSLEVPTILFEAGHYYDDYRREKVREFVVDALITALENIATGEAEEKNDEDYFIIPQNEKLFFDVILRRALLKDQIVDIAIQYKEELIDDKIEFIPWIEKIEANLKFYGHKEINCGEKEVKLPNGGEVSENVIVHNLLLKNEVLIIKYANN